MSIIHHPRGSTFCKQAVADVSHTTYDNVQGSPTKFKYSFGMSKATRFPKVKLRNHEQICYDLPTTKKPRAAGFGIGERFSDQAQKLNRNQNPSPDRYNIPTLFKPNSTTSTFANHMKGELTYSFGTGRDGFTKTVYNERLGNNKRIHQSDPATPGPGTYDPQHPLGVGSKSFKLKGKIAYGSVSYNSRAAERKGIPGAGTYEDTLSLNNIGVYNLNSQFSNSKAQKWSPPHDRFFRPKVTTDENPGPGQHEQFGEVGKGKHVSTHFHSTKTPSFGIGGRSRWTQRFQTPGPGAYRPPSDFGYVDVAKFIDNSYLSQFKSQMQMNDVQPIPENKHMKHTSPPMRRIDHKKMQQSASQSDSLQRQRDQKYQTPNKFKNNFNFHKRKSTMNPSVNQMNLTQDMTKLTQDLVQVSKTGAVGAGPIKLQHSEQNDKLFIKKNLNARTMRNTLQGGGNFYNTQSNVTPTAIPPGDQDYGANVNNRTQTQPRNNALGLTPNRFDSSDVHQMSLMTPNNMSLTSPTNAREKRGMTTTSNVDTAANTLTPMVHDKEEKDISTITQQDEQ